MIVLATLLLNPAQAGTLWVRPHGNAVPGEPITLRVGGATPGARVVVARGTAISQGTTCLPRLPCLDVDGATLAAGGVAEANGAVELTFVVPRAARPGATLAVQVVERGGGGASPAMTLPVTAHLPIAGVYVDPLGGADIEIDDQGYRDDWRDLSFADFDPAGSATGEWIRPNGWPYWMRLEWTEDLGAAWICLSMPNPAEATVRRLGPSDASNPSVGGCLGGPWTELVPAEPTLAGTWTTASGEAVTLTASAWQWGADAGAVTRYSNADAYLIGRFQGRFVRIDTTVAADGSAWACRGPALGSVWQARQASADPSDLATGCGGATWVALTPS